MNAGDDWLVQHWRKACGCRVTIEELRVAIVLNTYNQPHALWRLHLFERNHDLTADWCKRDDTPERLKIIGLNCCQSGLVLFGYECNVLRVKKCARSIADDVWNIVAAVLGHFDNDGILAFQLVADA